MILSDTSSFVFTREEEGGGIYKFTIVTVNVSPTTVNGRGDATHGYI